MRRREGIGFGAVYTGWEGGWGGGDPRWRIILDPYVFCFRFICKELYLSLELGSSSLHVNSPFQSFTFPYLQVRNYKK